MSQTVSDALTRTDNTWFTQLGKRGHHCLGDMAATLTLTLPCATSLVRRRSNGYVPAVASDPATPPARNTDKSAAGSELRICC